MNTFLFKKQILISVSCATFFCAGSVSAQFVSPTNYDYRLIGIGSKRQDLLPMLPKMQESKIVVVSAKEELDYIVHYVSLETLSEQDVQALYYRTDFINFDRESPLTPFIVDPGNWLSVAIAPGVCVKVSYALASKLEKLIVPDCVTTSPSRWFECCCRRPVKKRASSSIYDKLRGAYSVTTLVHAVTALICFIAGGRAVYTPYCGGKPAIFHYLGARDMYQIAQSLLVKSFSAQVLLELSGDLVVQQRLLMEAQGALFPVQHVAGDFVKVVELRGGAVKSVLSAAAA